MSGRWILPLFTIAIVAVLAACGDNNSVNGPAPAIVADIYVVKTSLGDITIELLSDDAPVTARNFLRYASDGFYGGLIIHRVIAGFVIQGGGFTTDLKRPRPTYAPIVNEAGNGLLNMRGTIAMVHDLDPQSATSQFFFNVTDNVFLNHHDDTPQGYGYAVFGRVVSGMDVVDRIAAVPTESRNGLNDVPVTPVVIRSVIGPGMWHASR